MATQSSLLDYLAGPALNELMLTMDVRRGLPQVLPAEFFKPSGTKPFGDKVIWEHRTGQRKPATIVNSMSPSVLFNPPQQQRAEATALTAKEHFPLDGETLQLLKANVPIINDRIKVKVIQDIQDWKIRFENLRTAATLNALFTGQISYLPSGTGAVPGLDGGAATGTGQIVASGTTNSVQVSYSLTNGSLTKNSTIPNATGSPTIGDWSSASTNIPASLRAIAEGFVKTNNYTPVHIFYGRSIPDYFIANTAMQTFLSRQPRLNEELMSTNEVPAGTLDYEWHPAWKAYYVDYNGNVVTPCAANQITICPAVTSDWYELVEGGNLVPTGIVPPGMSYEQATMQSKIVNGFFSYMDWVSDPYCLKIIGGDSFLPIIKVASAVWTATVS